MKSSIKEFEIQYKLYRRFLSIVDCIMTLGDSLRHIGYVRYKPLFAAYNTCIKIFKEHYDEQYKQMELEDLPLYDNHNRSLFTSNKISTLLHQSRFIIGFLEGELPPELLDKRERTTLVNVSSYADSQAAANSVARLQAEITLNSLYEVIKNSEFDDQTKSDLLNDVDDLKGIGKSDESKLKAFATKLAKKLIEVGERISTEVIFRLLSQKIGEG